jgi:tetratricopeptide (TPR) repeat protein
MSDGRRLNSWKEVAAYLQRDVRTVQRWESEGLPVYRLRHDKLATIYARTDEIDAWLNARSIRPAASSLITSSENEQREGASRADSAGRRGSRVQTRAVLALIGALLTVGAVFVIAVNRKSPDRSDVSLDAARALMKSDNYIAADGVLRRVVERHPSDPVAEIGLAWTSSAIGKPPAETAAWTDRAISHISNTTSPADEYFIRGTKAYISGDLDTAISLFRNALAANPDHYWTAAVLGTVYSTDGYDAFAVEMFKKTSDLDAASADTAILAASGLFQYGDYRGAMRYRERALASADVNPYDLCWLRLLPAQIAWVTGDRTRAVVLAQEAARKSDLSTWQNDEVRRRAAEVILLAGDQAQGDALLKSISDPRVRRFERLAWGVAHPDEAVTADDLPKAIYHHDAALLAAILEAGYPGAIGLMTVAEQRAQDAMAVELLKGKILQTRNDPAALDHFLSVIRQGPMVRSQVTPEKIRIDINVQFAGGAVGAVLQAMLGAAEAYQAAGRTAEATRLLEQIAQNRAQALLADVPGIIAWKRATQILAR